MSDDTKTPEPADLAEALVLHFDGVSRDGSRWFRCHCCRKDFLSAKRQDPQRDVGYGTCEACHLWWLNRGASADQRAAANERFARYA